MKVETRTIKKVSRRSVQFREMPRLSASKRWFPGVKEGQRWKISVDYSVSPVGKIIAAELDEVPDG